MSELGWWVILALVPGFLSGCAAWRTPVPDAIPSSPPAVVQPVSEGSVLYATHCASCHGVRGEGQPDWKIPDADGLLPAPPHDAFGHTWHHSDDVLLQIIAEGGTLFSPVSNMPGYSETLTTPQMESVLTHIKGLWGTEERNYQADITAEWEAANADETSDP